MATVKFDERVAERLHQSITKALKFGGMLAHFPQMIDDAIRHESWRFRYCRAKGRTFNSLLEYLEHNEPDGCQVDRETALELIEDQPDLAERVRSVFAGSAGWRREDGMLAAGLRRVRKLPRSNSKSRLNAMRAQWSALTDAERKQFLVWAQS